MGSDRVILNSVLLDKEPCQLNRETVFRHLGAIFFARVKELGDRPFLKLQQGNRTLEISWKDFGAKVQETILGLYALGIKKGDRIGIVSENRMEWLCTDAATIAGGLPNVIVSPRLSDKTIRKILNHSGARAVFVEGEAGLSRMEKLKDHLPSVETMIVMDKTKTLPPGSIAYEDLLSRGRAEDEIRIREILEAVRPGDLATIMYTSGSTGEPKGVMRTQENLLANVMGGAEVLPSKPDELFLVILSLNHLLGRFGFQKSMVTGRRTAIVEATELDLDLKEIQSLSPTAMTLVPRVMVRIWDDILGDGNNRRHWETIETIDQVKTSRGALSAEELQQYEAMRTALRESVMSALGGRIQYITYAGAPMPPRILRFFEVIGISLLGSYGTTECGGVTLNGLGGEVRPGSAGKPFPNAEVRIADDGEILVRGPAVFPGYFGDPEATRESLDPDGWCHTGDLGTLDADGFLYVVGRKKDVFYCSDGSNIYPGFIEVLLEQDPLIRQAALLGDRRPFMSALIVPNRERIAIELKKEDANLTREAIKRALWSRVQLINERLEQMEQIRKICVLEGDFPLSVRTVTAFQKTKIDRKEVEKHYKKEIEEIYEQPFV